MPKSVLRYSEGCALHTPEERADHWPYPLYWPEDEKARALWRESYLDLPPEDVRSDDEKARDKMIALLSGKAPDETDETKERHDEEDGLPPDEVARRAMIRRSNATG